MKNWDAHVQFSALNSARSTEKICYQQPDLPQNDINTLFGSRGSNMSLLLINVIAQLVKVVELSNDAQVQLSLCGLGGLKMGFPIP